MVRVRVRPETGRLYLDISFAGKRCKELTLLNDDPGSRARVEKLAARINADIASNSFEDSKYFPTGKNRNLFTTTEIQNVGGVLTRPLPSRSETPTLQAFSEIWIREKRPDWRQNTRAWIENILQVHLLPAFGKLGGYVFCGMRGNPIHDRAFRRWVWDPIIRHLGLKKRTPYQTRHTCATLWLASGENPEWVARQLGHTTTEMLFRVYSRFIPNLTRRDGSAFEQVLAARGFGGPVTPPASSSTGDA